MNDPLHSLTARCIKEPFNYGAFIALKKVISKELEDAVDSVLIAIMVEHQVLIFTAFFDLLRRHNFADLSAKVSSAYDHELMSGRFKQVTAFVDGQFRSHIDKSTLNHWYFKFETLVRLQGAEVIDASFDPRESNTISAMGINLAGLTALQNELFSVENNPFWCDYLKKASFINNKCANKAMLADAKCWFQDRIIRERKFSIPSVDNRGGHLECLDSFSVNGTSFYTFLGEELAVLMINGASSREISLYLPKRNIIVKFNSKLADDIVRNKYVDPIARYFLRAANNVENYIGMMDNKSPSPLRGIILKFNSAPNFAHHIWNYYSGFDRVLNSGLSQGLVGYCFPGPSFYGDLDQIFPELKGLENLPQRGSDGLDPAPFRGDPIVVPVGGGFFSEQLKERVLKSCEQHIRTIDHEVDLLERARESQCNIWFGIRIGDKSWLDQEQAIPKIIDHLNNKFDNLTFYLDSFSFSTGKINLVERWKLAFENLKLLCESITQTVANPDTVVNLTGLSLPVATLVARETHLYLSPLGTTQHKVGWFSRGKGLIYLPNSAKGRDPIGLQGTWETENLVEPDFCYAIKDVAGERHSYNDKRSLIDNMELDVDEILDWFENNIPEDFRR